ncbi:MAG TPA: peptidylprolyl isomerase, partial [Clostridia bacterium]|nr:peptidylprolyl isomerase [Clostridia bacterium]
NQKAKEAGFLVTDELRDEAKRELDDLRENIREQIEEDAKNSDEDEEDEDEKKSSEEQAQDYIENQLAAMGKTEEEYIEISAQQKCIDKLFEKVVDDVEVSVDEISKYYEEELPKQKENPASIEGSPVVLYEPSRIRVKHVFIDIPEEKINEYNELLQQEKEDEAQELSDKELAAIKGKADGILVRAKNGEDFIKLVEEVNPSNVEMMEEGMVTYKDSPYLPDEYKEAAFKIEEGEISGLIKTPYGYYIIQVNEKLPENIYSQDDKKDDIEDKLTKDKENEKWKETVEEWKKVGIKKFEKRL